MNVQEALGYSERHDKRGWTFLSALVVRRGGFGRVRWFVHVLLSVVVVVEYLSRYNKLWRILDFRQ